jgi:hypothetical protein
VSTNHFSTQAVTTAAAAGAIGVVNHDGIAFGHRQPSPNISRDHSWTSQQASSINATGANSAM